MATEKQKSLRQFTQERFQQEVARELGIDLSPADQVPGVAQRKLPSHTENPDGEHSEDKG